MKKLALIFGAASAAISFSCAYASDGCPSGVPIQNISWQQIENSQKIVDAAVIEKFMPVLRDGHKFRWYFDGQYDNQVKSVKEGSEISLADFVKIVDEEIFEADYDDKSVFVDAAACADLDGDGTRELILLLGNGHGHYLILHKDSTGFTASNRVYRAFGDLRSNGVFCGANGSGTAGYYKLSFKNGKISEEMVGMYETDYKTQNVKYTYKGIELSESEWNKKLFGGSKEIEFYYFK